MDKLARLDITEDVRFDGQRLDEIMDELGERAAESVICAALEQLAAGLGAVRAAALSGDGAAVVAQAEAVARLAWQLGLVTLAGVAVDVGRCAEHGDQPALAATLGRLMRVGRRSLTEIWDDADLVG
ncbi:hypothetical protein KTN05_04985 [Paracoccus sp. Z118]|uniref:hypothetical protein n=1 Tax=Paracoccus sp. Z118 TaxID=2851017 RepID=UPI001C2BC836|nr:hypothetical protein [Paracoccus sp. Z118]MBV0891205.1 hypothetical protein [Paracoccus sp. Z118]